MTEGLDPRTAPPGPLRIEVVLSKEKKSQTFFGRFLSTPVGSAVLTLVFTTLIGGAVTAGLSYGFAVRERNAADYTRRVEAAAAGRRALIDAISSTFGARLNTQALVLSAIRDHAAAKEVRSRWLDYQKAYSEFQTSFFSFEADLLNFFGYADYERFRPVLEGVILPSFTRVDGCLTDLYRAWDAKQAKPLVAKLERCKPPPAPSWNIVSENRELGGCFGNFQVVLMDAIYLEDRYDQLHDPDPRRKVFRVHAINNPDPKSMQKIKAREITSDTWRQFLCDSADFVCARALAKASYKTRLMSTDACKTLAAETKAAQGGGVALVPLSAARTR